MIFKEYAIFDGLGLAELVKRGDVSIQDLVDSALDVIQRQNPKVNCVVQHLPKHAKKTDRSRSSNGPIPWCAFPRQGVWHALQGTEVVSRFATRCGPDL